MSEMPESWTTASLEVVAHVEMGQSPESRFYNARGEGLPFFQGKADFGALFPTIRKWCSQPSKIAEAGDILLSVRAPVGPTNLASEKCCIGRGLAAIRADEQFSQKYLLHFFRNIQPWLTEQGTGTTFAAVSSNFLRSLQVIVAPANEQKRIADKLDAVLARVDACRERLNRMPPILKRFRHSVLAAATSGKLTEHWRSSLNDATNWESGKLESLLEAPPRNGYSPRAVEYETRVKTLRLTATTSGRFLPEHFKYIDEEIPESSYLWLQPGDILIQRANTIEYVGVSAIYDGPPSGFIYPDLMMKCRANQRVHPNFLHYLLLSEPVRRYFRENATGTAGNMPKINQKTVTSAPVSWPSRKEQAEIVRRVEALFAHADSLETRYTAARNRVERLTPALLAKAFHGELTPQDPNDEPASVLLERIRATREIVHAKPKQLEIVRGAKMSKATPESIRGIIRQLPDDRFTFDDLRSRASADDYETLKDILFVLLSEAQPTLKQVFDTKAQSMRFVRVNQ